MCPSLLSVLLDKASFILKFVISKKWLKRKQTDDCIFQVHCGGNMEMKCPKKSITAIPYAGRV